MPNDMNIKVLYLNPVGNGAYDRVFADMIEQYKYPATCADVVSMNPARTRSRLQIAAVEAVQVHKAESIILDCTLEIGFYRELQDYLNGPEAFPGAGIPVIDPSIAAFKAAENAALLKKYGWKNSRYGSMQPPPEDELRAFNLFREDYEFGNVIHVPAE